MIGACPVNLLLAIAIMHELRLMMLTVSNLLLLWNCTLTMLSAVWFTGCSRLLLVAKWTDTLCCDISSRLLLLPINCVVTILLLLVRPTVTTLLAWSELKLASWAPPITFECAVSIRHGVIRQLSTVNILVTRLLGRKVSTPVMRRLCVL